eukprot:4115-Heterococcus_DN1.PRE.3
MMVAAAVTVQYAVVVVRAYWKKETVRCELTVNSAQDQNTKRRKNSSENTYTAPPTKLYTQKAAHHIIKCRQVEMSH